MHRAPPGGDNTGGSVGGNAINNNANDRHFLSEWIAEEEEQGSCDNNDHTAGNSDPPSSGLAAAFTSDHNNSNDDNVSVSSAGTDRASNHNPSSHGGRMKEATAMNTIQHHQQQSQQQQQQQQSASSPTRHSISMPVPTTVVANTTTTATTDECPVKLTAEALAEQNRALQGNTTTNNMGLHQQPFVGGEDVSSLGSLAEVAEDNSALLLLPPTMIDGCIVEKEVPISGSEAGSEAEAEAPISGGIDAGIEREVPISGSETSPGGSAGGSLKRDLSEMALDIHQAPTAAVETPPKDNLSSSTARMSNLVIGTAPVQTTAPNLAFGTRDELGSTVKASNAAVTTPNGKNSTIPIELRRRGSNEIPIELARLHPAQTPPSAATPSPSFSHGGNNRLLPMGGGNSVGSGQHSVGGTKVRVDKTIASTRPPNSAAHPPPPLPKVSASNPFPNSPKPPSAIKVTYEQQCSLLATNPGQNRKQQRRRQ